jgi:hypothetical protein
MDMMTMTMMIESKEAKINGTRNSMEFSKAVQDSPDTFYFSTECVNEPDFML